jgi:Ser/Thr protein kinase RdoA (MazF antagonist)
VCWGGLVDAVQVARRFGLGGAARLSDGPVARGKQGLVWRLDTTDGSWAVKMPFHPSGEGEVRSATAFQEAACAAGVPAPQVRRTTGGCVFATCEGRQVRVYEWVDLHAPDARIDPEQVGAVVAAVHRVSATDPSPLDPWYHEPVGAGRWDQLARQLLEAGAPFARRLAGVRDELVALESWIEPPDMLQTCHRDLWADNILATADGGVCVAQLGHITETAATDWLKPNPRSPQRSDSAAWIGEVLDEPHTRELLDALLAATEWGATAHRDQGT